jgi:hypothetical protein
VAGFFQKRLVWYINVPNSNNTTSGNHVLLNSTAWASMLMKRGMHGLEALAKVELKLNLHQQ